MIVITPYYGDLDEESGLREEYLSKTLCSVNRQCEDIHHIIVDDGSTDGVCSSLSIGDCTTVVRRERDSSDKLTCSNAVNYGLKTVFQDSSLTTVRRNHDYLTVLHSDDLAYNLHLRSQFMDNNDIDFLYTDAELFTDNDEWRWEGETADLPELRKRLWINGTMPYPTMTWRLNLLNELIKYTDQAYNMSGLYDPNIGSSEDVDVALTTLEFVNNTEYEMGYLSKVTAGYRLHRQGLAEIRSNLTRMQEESSVLVKHFGRIQAVTLHLRRIFVRPERYFPQFRKIRAIIPPNS